MVTENEVLSLAYDCKLLRPEWIAKKIMNLINEVEYLEDIECIYHHIKHHHKLYTPDNTTKMDILMGIDILLCNYGVEYISHCGQDFYYSNAGDTYNATICLKDGEFIIASWGDIYEEIEREDYDEAIYAIKQDMIDIVVDRDDFTDQEVRDVFGWLFDSEKPTLSADIQEADVVEACQFLGYNIEEYYNE